VGHLRNDHERRRPIPLDVELDAPKALERDGERHPFTSRDYQAAVGHRKHRLCRACPMAELLAGFEGSQNVWLEVRSGIHRVASGTRFARRTL
jgi:hypothetical protein